MKGGSAAHNQLRGDLSGDRVSPSALFYTNNTSQVASSYLLSTMILELLHSTTEVDPHVLPRRHRLQLQTAHESLRWLFGRGWGTLEFALVRTNIRFGSSLSMGRQNDTWSFPSLELERSKRGNNNIYPDSRSWIASREKSAERSSIYTFIMGQCSRSSKGEGYDELMRATITIKG